MALQSEKRRLAKLIALARPRNSLAARVAALPPHSRKQFDAWKRSADAWIDQHETEPGGAYAAMLDGANYPQLPHHLELLIFGPRPVVLVSDDEEVTVEKYRELRT